MVKPDNRIGIFSNIWGQASQRKMFCLDKKCVILKLLKVKLVFKDHPREQQNVVLTHRWSLYAGSVILNVLHLWGPVKCGLYNQVVFIYRWH